MTRTTRKTIAFIVCVAFIAAIVCFFAVATKGFRYWDGATWFDYWGKGKPKATQQVDKPADKPENSDEPVSVSMAAANAGLTYDSEDAAATVEVKRYPAPTVQFGYEGDPCFLIQTSGYIIPQFQVRYIHFMGDYTISTQVYNYDHVNGDSGFVLGLNDLGDAGCTPLY